MFRLVLKLLLPFLLFFKENLIYYIVSEMDSNFSTISVYDTIYFWHNTNSRLITTIKSSNVTDKNYNKIYN